MTKIHVGITRKSGQPNYGSFGAECHLEIETDLRAPDETLPQRIREAFNVCRQEVDRELKSGSTIEGHAHQPTVPMPPISHADEHRTAKRSPQRSQRVRPASDAQVRAIHAIAAKANVGLASQLSDDFGVGTPQQLTLRQASDLIKNLKSKLPA